MGLNWKSFLGIQEEQVPQIGAVGISITHNKILIAHIGRDEVNKIKVIFMTSEAADTMEKREEVLRAVVEQNDLAGQKCFLVLNEHEYKMTMIDTPPDLDEDDIQGSIAEYTEDYLDYKIDNSSVDIYHIPFKRANDRKRVSFLVSLDLDLMKKFEQLVLKSGLVLSGIDIPELAYRNVLGLQKTSEKGRMIIKLSENGGNAYIFYEEHLLMSRRMTPKVGVDLSNFLLTSNKIIDEVEYDRTLTNLTTYIQRTIDYCDSVFREASVEEFIYLPSNVVNVEAIKLFIDKHISLKSQMFNINNFVSIPEEFKHLDMVEFLPVIGVALDNLEDEENAKN